MVFKDGAGGGNILCAGMVHGQEDALGCLWLTVPLFSIPPWCGCCLSSLPSPASAPGPCSSAGSAGQPCCSSHRCGPVVPQVHLAWPGCPGRGARIHHLKGAGRSHSPLLLSLRVSQGPRGVQGAEELISAHGRNPERSWERWDLGMGLGRGSHQSTEWEREAPPSAHPLWVSAGPFFALGGCYGKAINEQHALGGS